MKSLLQPYKDDLEKELERILSFWILYATDEEHGGYFGRIDNKNTVCKEAAKGSVLHSRILWAFSAAYDHTGNPAYFSAAHRAFRYLKQNFVDREFGGVYWTVNYCGKALDTKKQIYALAFAVYGLSEFYKAAGAEDAKELAIDLYRDIIRHSYDPEYGGYLEALSRQWEQMDDLRLSSKDANEKKSMNTHLHVLEGFANLYRIWPDETLKERITELIDIFLNHIISPRTNHLILFFDEKWNPKSEVISYGHDIEASWLILEAAEVIGNEELASTCRQRAVVMANAAAEGLAGDGGLWYEYHARYSQLIKEKHSWPQAESMTGFFNAWEITGKKEYLLQSLASWNFVKKHLVDKVNGEWFWGIREDGSIMIEDKVGRWKGPYHNSRACIEIIKRIKRCDDSIKT